MMLLMSPTKKARMMTPESMMVSPSTPSACVRVSASPFNAISAQMQAST